jgi:hypothetical protein
MGAKYSVYRFDNWLSVGELVASFDDCDLAHEYFYSITDFNDGECFQIVKGVR